MCFSLWRRPVCVTSAREATHSVLLCLLLQVRYTSELPEKIHYTDSTFTSLGTLGCFSYVYHSIVQFYWNPPRAYVDNKDRQPAHLPVFPSHLLLLIVGYPGKPVEGKYVVTWLTNTDSMSHGRWFWPQVQGTDMRAKAKCNLAYTCNYTFM